MAFAASVYLVYVLEILKLRRLRSWQLRRADPDTSEHEIDIAVSTTSRPASSPRFVGEARVRTRSSVSPPFVPVGPAATVPYRTESAPGRRP